MLKRFSEFLEIDRAARRRVIIVSAIVTALWGFFAESARPLLEVEREAALLGVLAFGLQLFWYCLAVERPFLKFTSVPMTIPRRRFATALALLFIAAIPTPIIEAAVLDRKLRGLTASDRISSETAKDIRSTLKIARASLIRFPEKTQRRVYDVLKTSALAAPSASEIVKSANSFIDYTRSIYPPVNEVVSDEVQRPSGVPGIDKFLSGMHHYAQAILPMNSAGVADPNEARAALSDFTSFIDVYKPEDKLLRAALMTRALMRLALQDWAGALDDANRLEALRDVDLADIVSIEGLALMGSGGEQNLRRSIKFFSLAAQLPVPSYIPAGDDVVFEKLMRIDAVGNRAQAFFKLGEFEQAINDADQVLAEVDNFPGLKTLYYRRANSLKIMSYLQLGRPDTAMAVAKEWARDTRDPVANSIVENLRNPQKSQTPSESIPSPYFNLLGNR